MKGYALVNGVCKREIYKCREMDVNGNCVRCEDGFNLQNNVCIADGCQSYSPSTYVCFKCLSGYILNLQS